MTFTNQRKLLVGDGFSAFGSWIDFLAILTMGAYQFKVGPFEMRSRSRVPGVGMVGGKPPMSP